MISEAKVTKFVKLISWFIAGASFAGAVIGFIIKSEFVFRRAVYWSVILAVVWAVIWFLFTWLGIRADKNSKIVSPGKQIHWFFIGAIVVLWIPLILVPFKAQKVELILDISQRMGEEFDAPGTTKLDAARSGILQVLGYLESQNMEVALRLVNSNKNGQCAIEPETSLAVDFTKDFDKIRNYLGNLQPAVSDNAPVVRTIDSSINHYLDKKIFDQKFYLYSFIGGDDTCGEKLGVYLTSPKVIDNAITSELFLIILLGTDEEKTLHNLPNAKLDYARSLAQVQQIVNSNNQLIAVPTPTPTLSPSPSSSPTSSVGSFMPTQAGVFIEQGQIEATNPPANLPIASSEIKPTFTQAPIYIATQTPDEQLIMPPPSNIPSNTPTFTPIPAPTFTNTIIPSPIPSPTSACPPATHPYLAGPSGGTVYINSPGHCSIGHPPETAIYTSGSYSNIPDGTIVWVLAYAPDNLYYPQSPNACAGAPPPNQGGGSWDVNTYLGLTNDPPKWYDIVVVLTDQTASDYLTNWLTTGCSSGFPGIPPGTLAQLNITEMGYITVQTK